MTEQATPAKMATDITAMTIIAAIVAALGAVAIFQPKFAISAAMKRETGSVEPAFRVLYAVPQYLNVALIAGLCIALIGACVQSIDPAIFAQYRFLTSLGGFFVPNNIIWIILMAAFIGAIVKFNWLSWILLALSRTASFLPIPWLQGVYGPHGQSVGWLQAFNVCRAWDSGQPILLCHDQIDRVADQVLFRLSQPASSASNFAARPTKASTAARANIALFGCVLEATHYAQKWSLPPWAEFYAALAAIHTRTQLFEPSELQKIASGDEFADRLRGELVSEMSLQRQPIPDDKYLAAADSLASIWNRLHPRSGNVLNLIPAGARLVGGSLYWLDRRLSELPMLNSEGMRPQLIKLLARWETIPWAKTSVFIQPFAKKQGWLLLQETALRVFPEQKDVTFWSVGDVQLTRLACIEVFENVKAKVRHPQSAEAKSVNQAHPEEWDLFAAADYCLWNMASEMEASGRADNWDTKKGWRWKFENGRASKVS